jgi:surface antigen
VTLSNWTVFAAITLASGRRTGGDNEKPSHGGATQRKGHGMKTIARRALLVLTLAAAAPLFAAGWVSVLRGTPGEDFDDEDLRQFLVAAKQTLEAPAPPQTVSWSNAESGAGGSFLVLGEPKVKNFEVCRRTRITLYSKKRKGYPTIVTACKDPTSGRWLMVGAG